MTAKVIDLLEKMTPAEQSEVASFAVFVIARRKLQKTQILTNDIPADDLLKLAESSGSFDWLASEKEDVYTLNDGEEAGWASA